MGLSQHAGRSRSDSRLAVALLPRFWPRGFDERRRAVKRAGPRAQVAGTLDIHPIKSRAFPAPTVERLTLSRAFIPSLRYLGRADTMFCVESGPEQANWPMSRKGEPS